MKKLPIKLIGVLILTLAIYPSVSFAFTDTSGHLNEDAINTIEINGIVEGYSNNTFRPDIPINRAEFTKIIIGSLYPNETEIRSGCFSDVANEWFAKYVCLAKEMEIISGYPDDSFMPGNEINLAEALKILIEANKLETFTESDIWYEPYFEYAEDRNLLDGVETDVSQSLSRGEMAQLIVNFENYIENSGTYTFEDYGISFNYPFGWVINFERSHSIEISPVNWEDCMCGPPQLPSISVNDKDEMSIDDYIELYEESEYIDDLQIGETLFGENLFTTMTYYSESMLGYEEENFYLIELDQTFISVRLGTYDLETMSIVLESIHAH